MIAALAAGLQLSSAAGQILVMAATVLGMCFIWLTLEAVVSEGETPAGLQRMVGIYNIVWAGIGALAYFTGGALVEYVGFDSLFYVPLAILFVQLGLTLWLEAKNSKVGPVAHNAPLAPPTEQSNPRPIAKAKTFLRMAWLANPFAYIAVNTLIAVIPDIARRLELSTMLAGFCCSVWCFARVGAFFALWYWDGWHYRFRWLLAAFLALIGTFAIILMIPNLAVLVAAQIVFGAALGLIYSSSLFYSMDASETKGTHGGIHEAAIGLGNFAGPAIGAASLHLWPQYRNSAALAVTGLLVLGLGGLLAIWRLGAAQARPKSK